VEPEPLALVVLGTSQSDHRGSYSISRGCRKIVAEAEQLAERLEPVAVVLSGWAPDGGESEAEQMRKLWRAPKVELILEETATTTAENAARTLPLLLDRGVGRALVVCAPLHLFRTRWLFRRVYGAHGIETDFHVARVAPTPGALAWELGALTVLSRQLRAAKAEVERA
jgi:uncharacterized SAM-binding protein YcdF (DUF218 family)